MCLNPIHINSARTKYKNRHGIEQKRSKTLKSKEFVPCGKCHRCELKKRKDWAFRMHWESLDHVYSWFIRLSYAPVHAPFVEKKTGIWSRGLELDQTLSPDSVEMVLDKKDVQDFVKRLRSRQQYYLEKKGYAKMNLRYFIVGEYGDKFTRRPHYHLVLWSVHPDIIDFLKAGQLWAKGYVDVRPLKTGNVAGFLYLTKYVYKQQGNQHNRLVKPFTLQSRKPYIGNRFEKYGKVYYNQGEPMVKFNGGYIKIPRIYIDRLPDIKKRIMSKKLIESLDKHTNHMVRICNRRGDKPYELLLMEKNDYYESKFRKEKELVNY